MNASTIRNRPAILAGAALLTLLGTGCATKKHVRQVVGPVETQRRLRRTAHGRTGCRVRGCGKQRIARRRTCDGSDRKAAAAGQAAQAAGQAAQTAQTRADSAHGLAGEAKQMADQTEVA